jgi:hypothetical protein
MRGAERDAAVIFQTGETVFMVSVPPAAEYPLTYPEQGSGLHLAQFGSLRPVESIFKAHPAYPLVNVCGFRVNRTFHELQTPDKSRVNHTRWCRTCSTWSNALGLKKG